MTDKRIIDLEQAMPGDVYKTRDGRKAVFIIKINLKHEERPYEFMVENCPLTQCYNRDGKIVPGKDSMLDLVRKVGKNKTATRW